MTSSTETSDEELAAIAAREGSAGLAFDELLRRFQPRIWRICFRLMSHDQDAADATQEVCLRLFLHRERFAGRSKYSTWVYGIAVNTCLTQRRGRGRRKKRETDVDSETLWAGVPDREAAPEGIKLDMQQMLETLEEEDRALLILKYAENYSHEELAEIFDLGESACKMRISRARDKLKQRFGDPNEQAEKAHRGESRGAFMNMPLDEFEDDPFAALIATPIPPVPRDVGARVHEGINRVLTTEQLCEGLLTDLPKAGWELFQAILGGAAWTLSSQEYPRDTTDKKQSSSSRS